MAGRILILFITFFGPAFPAFGLDVEGFRYHAALNGPFRENNLYQVHLDERILKKCLRRCDNLRMLDSEGREIPYVIVDHVVLGKPTKRYSMKVTAYDAGDGTETLVMELPEEHEAIQSLELITPDRDFRKRGRIYSRPDGNKWIPLADDAFYDFSSRVSLRKTRIEFPAIADRLLKVVLTDADPVKQSEPSVHLRYNGLDFNAAESTRKKMRLSGFIGRTESEEGPPDEFDEFVVKNPPMSRDEGGNSVISIDADLPFDRIDLDILNPYYYREVDVYSGIKGDEGSYKLMFSGPVYRFPFFGTDPGNNEIAHSSPKHSSYKIVVRNGNNPPLDIKSVRLRWIRKDLYFIPLKDAPGYMFYIGGTDIVAPNYDLARLVGREDWLSQPHKQVTFGPLEEKRNGDGWMAGLNRARLEKGILFLVILLVSVGLSYWLYSLLKKADGTRHPPGS